MGWVLLNSELLQLEKKTQFNLISDLNNKEKLFCPLGWACPG